MKPEEVLRGVLLDATSHRWRTSCTKLHNPHAIAARLATHRSSASSRCRVGCSRRACARPTAEILYLAGFSLCGNDSSQSHFSAMTLPCWLRRAVRNRHRHAIEQAARRWRGGRRDDSARTRRKILTSTQAGGQVQVPGQLPRRLRALARAEEQEGRQDVHPGQGLSRRPRVASI